MPAYTCKSCGLVVEAPDTPRNCARCYRPASEAFGDAASAAASEAAATSEAAPASQADAQAAGEAAAAAREKAQAAQAISDAERLQQIAEEAARADAEEAARAVAEEKAQMREAADTAKAARIAAQAARVEAAIAEASAEVKAQRVGDDEPAAEAEPPPEADDGETAVDLVSPAAQPAADDFDNAATTETPTVKPAEAPIVSTLQMPTVVEPSSPAREDESVGVGAGAGEGTASSRKPRPATMQMGSGQLSTAPAGAAPAQRVYGDEHTAPEPASHTSGHISSGATQTELTSGQIASGAIDVAASSPPAVREEPSIDASGMTSGLAKISTLELDDDDLRQAFDVSDQRDEDDFDDDYDEPTAVGFGLAPSSTQEILEDDLLAAAAPPPTPAAKPPPIKEDAAPIVVESTKAQRDSPSGVDKLKDPTGRELRDEVVRPKRGPSGVVRSGTSARRLTSQTERLADGIAGEHKRKQRRLVVVLWIAAIGVAGFATYRLVFEDKHKGGAAGTASASGLAVNVVDAGVAPKADTKVARAPDAAAAQADVAVAKSGAVDAASATGKPDAARKPAVKRRVVRRRVPPTKRRTPLGKRPPSKRPPTKRVVVVRRPPTPPPTKAASGAAAAKAAYGKGLRALLTSKPNQAIVHFNSALRSRPGYSLAYRGLGLAYEKLGRKALARAAYQQYLVRRPSAGDAALIKKRIARLQ